jgi:hypothetical protein
MQAFEVRFRLPASASTPAESANADGSRFTLMAVSERTRSGAIEGEQQPDDRAVAVADNVRRAEAEVTPTATDVPDRSSSLPGESDHAAAVEHRRPGFRPL